MTEVTLEQAAIRDAVQEAVQREAHSVLQNLLADGVEFEAVLNCIRVWAAKTRGIAFGRAQVWHVHRTNGLRILDANGDKLTFLSFHELLQWLLDQPALDDDYA